MTNTELTVTVDAETEQAVEAIDKVTAAIERLNAALEELEDATISMEVQGMNTSTTSNFTVDSDEYDPFKVSE